MQQREDLTRVFVYGGDIEAALRLLKRRMEKSKLFSQLKLRELYPATRARRKQKRYETTARIRAERRKKNAQL